MVKEYLTVTTMPMKYQNFFFTRRRPDSEEVIDNEIQ